MSRRRLIAVVLAIVGLALVMAYLAGLLTSKIGPQSLPVALPNDTKLATVTVQAAQEIVLEHAVGSVRALYEALVAARITARIASVSVRAGDSVAVGDVLVELDSRELKSRLEQQQQGVAAARSRLLEIEPDYQRTEALVRQGTLAKAALDRAEAMLGAARAELARARQAVDEAQTALSDSIIRAPFSGRIIDRFAEQGDMATPGTPLIRLYDPQRLRLEAFVRESLASRLRSGQVLQAKIDVLDESFSVQVDEIVPSADTGSRTFLVKAALPVRPHLYPGMFGRLLLPSGIERRFYIPSDAVQRVGQLEFVRVVDETGVTRRYVRTGLKTHDGRVEVLSGLRENERVVVANASQ